MSDEGAYKQNYVKASAGRHRFAAAEEEGTIAAEHVQGKHARILGVHVDLAAFVDEDVWELNQAPPTLENSRSGACVALVPRLPAEHWLQCQTAKPRT
jgi:hypothetical protein